MWPAYVRAHKGVLEGGDVEHGKPTNKVKDLILVEGLDQSLGEVVDLICGRLVKTVDSA